jgi:hypothetical protein
MVDIMAVVVIKNAKNLDRGFILTPERYNPKRRLFTSNSSDYVNLADIVTVINEIVSPKQFDEYEGKTIIVNTGDAYEGHIRLLSNREHIWNSNKKIVKPGDVIVSRLRPYLRQIAYVDSGIFCQETNCICAVSTEFYVLRSQGKANIAFLVPLLLSDKIQTILCNAVEGSQHPRFKEEVLLDIAIPKALITKADELSLIISENVCSIRKYEKTLNESINSIAQYFS